MGGNSMKLYDWMQEKGYSIRSLAKKADVAASTIDYIINGRKGQTHYASAEVRRKISEALGVEAREIDEFVTAIEYYRGKDLLVTGREAHQQDCGGKVDA